MTQDKDGYIVSFHFNLKDLKLFKWIETLFFYFQQDVPKIVNLFEFADNHDESYGIGCNLFEVHEYAPKFYFT